HIIAVSNSLQDYLIGYGVDRSRISVVWNGVETNKNIEKHAPKDRIIVGTVALFRPRKGLEVLIDAMAQLVSAGQNIVLRAVGEFETRDYKEEVLSLVQHHGIEEHIEWVGFTDDIASEFSCMDLFVLPSLYGEGLPMVVLEAMANKVPVISTRVEGVPEALPDNDYGMLVEPGQSTQLAECIATLAKDEEKRELLADNSYQRQKDYFSAESMAHGVAMVYEKILSDKDNSS
ncbi:MAG TPA: glycosyltransferase family 1 protein, partial [Chromatiales bacterium]|nr:glycosyltransferase family 1 protein [Chromatiales bacterium]